MSPSSRYVLATVLAWLCLAPNASADITVEANPLDALDPNRGSNITVTEDAGTPGPDAITITEDGPSYTIARDGGGLTAAGCAGGGAAVTCSNAQSISINLGAGDDSLITSAVVTPLGIAGGPGNDTLRGGAGNDVLAGGDGNDDLDGGLGFDGYFGEAGDDVITSRDGTPERIACGAGSDRVDNDFTDIIAECERGTDNDGDGFSTAVDCNDLAAGTFPGAPDPENGVDEDCDGQDDRNLDRDGDGFPVPIDCDDANGAIRPNAREVRGNKVDENCDRRADPFSVLPSLVSTNWGLAASYTQLRKLVVRNAPAGARVVFSCKGPGCTLRRKRTVRVRRDLAPVSLRRFFGRGRFRPGSRLTVSVAAVGAIGRTYRYRIERRVLPVAAIVCRAPGQKRGRPC